MKKVLHVLPRVLEITDYPMVQDMRGSRGGGQGVRTPSPEKSQNYKVL